MSSMNKNSLTLAVALAIGFASFASAAEKVTEQATAKQEQTKPAPQAAQTKVAAPTKAHDHAPSQKTDKTKQRAKTKLKIGKNDTVITVGNMHCKHCAKKIAGKLYKVKGVVKVRTDVGADIAIITPQKNKQLSIKSLWTASQKAGFQPELLEGPAGKYQPDAKTKAPKLVPVKAAKPVVKAKA